MSTVLDGIGSWLMQASLYGSLLILLVLALRRMGVAWLHPRWAFALWIVVLARLVLPAAPEARFSLYNVAEAGRPVVARAVGLAEPAPARESPSRADAPARPADHAAAAPRGGAGWWTLPRALVVAWGIGVIGAAMAVGVGQRRLGRMAARARQACDPGLVALVEECKARLGVRSPIMVAHSLGVTSPLLLGTVRPVLLIPEGLSERLGRDELRAVVMHEVAHVRRRDIALGWAATAALLLHWFNPLVWVAVRKMKEDREVACDALALSALGTAERPAYGRALVTLLENATRPRMLPGLAAIAEGTGDMKRRVAMIASFRQRGPWAGAAAAGLVAVLACVSLTDAQPQKSPEPPVAVGPAPADVTARGVMDRMLKVYAECKSYQDEGEVVTVFVDRPIVPARRMPFSTRFVRPDRFRYEFRDQTGPYVVWADEKGASSWWALKPDVQQFPTIEMALAGPTGISGGSATMIPTILFPEMHWGNKLGHLTDLELHGIEKVDGRACYKVTGVAAGGWSITFWVDTESHLVRRTFERHRVDPAKLPDAIPGEPFTTETTMTFDPKVNEAIPAERLRFEPPK